MKKRKCPFQSYLVTTTIDGKHKNEIRKGNCPQTDLCQGWDFTAGDCGLKVARGDRYKEMWEALKKRWGTVLCTPCSFMRDEMDKIEAEMGKG